MDKTLEQNRKLLLIRGFLGYETILAPVIAVFYIKYVGLSFSQYAFLESLLTILIAFFEIPSGYLADRLGRKKLYIMSQTSYIFSKLIVCMFPSFLVAIASTMIAGISLSMSSGNLEAIYYEAFATEDKVDELRRLYGKAASLTFVTSIFTSIVGGYLASIQIVLPIIVDTTVIAIGVLFTWWLLKEAPRRQEVEIFVGNYSLIKFKKTFEKLFRYEGLLLFTLISSLVFATLRVSYTFYQPYLQSSGVKLEYFGFVFAGFNMVSAVFSYLENKVINWFDSEKKLVLCMGFILIISFAGLYYFQSMIGIAFLFLQQVVRGFSQPFFAVQKNKYIPIQSDSRVTLLSIGNFVSMLLISFGTFFLSIMTGSFSLRITILSCGLLFCILLVIFALIHEPQTIKESN